MAIQHEEQVKEIYRRLGYNTILPLQKKAFEQEEVFARHRNVFVIGDTSSGKTLIPLVLYSIQKMEAEKESLEQKERMLFVLPYRTLASQKGQEIEDSLHRIFPELRVAVSTGERRENDGQILRGNVDVAVIIYEKMCRFSRLEEDFLGMYNMIVFDEFSLVENDGRGVQCDMAFLYALRQKRKIIILTTPHYCWSSYVRSGDFLLVEDHFDEKAYAVPRKEIPIEFSLHGNSKTGSITVQNGEELELPKEGSLDDIIEGICVGHLRRKHRILVFINDCQEVRRHALELYRRLATKHRELLNPCDREPHACFDEILKQSGLLEDDLLSMMQPEECYAFRCGISYHNSWLGYELRGIVEEEILMRNGCLKVVFSTETMAYGINSNVDVVIVADMYKSVNCHSVFLDEDGKVHGANKIINRFLTLSEYQNYVGRAGRYGQCDMGYAYPILRCRIRTQEGTSEKNRALTKWKKMKAQQNNLHEVRSALLKLDGFCKACKRRGKKGCRKCRLAADEIGMLVLGLLDKQGLTKEQIKEAFLQLPGMKENADFLDFSLGQALGRLVYRDGLVCQICDPLDGAVRYAVTVSGQDVRGIYVTLSEYHQLRNAVQSTDVKQLIQFDFFYNMSCLREIYNLAFTFFETHDDQRKRKLKQICKNVLEKLYRGRQISKDLYLLYVRPLDPYHGGGVKYTDLYRLLISILLYTWYLTGSIGEVSNSLLLDGEEVIAVTPGRITNVSQQFSFYIQVMSAISSSYAGKEELKVQLDIMEICLYYGIRKDTMEKMGMDKLYDLNRWQRNLVAEVLEFCNSYGKNQPMQTRRGRKQYRQILDSFQRYLKDTPVGEALMQMYPEVIDLAVFK